MAMALVSVKAVVMDNLVRLVPEFEQARDIPKLGELVVEPLRCLGRDLSAERHPSSMGVFKLSPVLGIFRLPPLQFCRPSSDGGSSEELHAFD